MDVSTIIATTYSDIPSQFSGSALFSACGIIYLIICLSFFCKGFWYGIMWNMILFVLGLMLFYSLTGEQTDSYGDIFMDQQQQPTNDGWALVYLDQYGKNPVTKYDLYNHPDRIEYFPPYDMVNQDLREVTLRGHKYILCTKEGEWLEPVYAMHVKELGCYISPKIFHPGVLFWPPGVFALPFFLGAMAIFNRK
jgi:hypothetical protein